MCDPKTVIKYLRGLPQAWTIQERVKRALVACGFAHLVEQRAAAAPLAKTASTPPPSR